MPIDYTTPTISPPSVDDPFVTDEDDPGIPSSGDMGLGSVAPPAAEPAEWNVSDALDSFSQDALKSPGRWDSDMIQQGLGMIRERSDIAQEDQMSVLDERMSMRGAVGSSIEADSTVDLLGQLNRSRQEQEYGLLTQAANANAADRTSAAGIASDKANIDQRLEAMRLEYAARGEAFDIDRERIKLQNDQFQSKLTAEQQQFQAQLGEAQASRLQELGLSQQDFDQRALQLQQDAQQAGRSMDLQEARDTAEINYRIEALQQDAEIRGEAFDIERARMDLQGEQFNREIDLKATEIANRSELEGRQMTLAEAKLEAENRWETERLGEARATRIQDAGIKGRDLDLRSEQIAKQYNLSDKELARDYAELDLRREAMLSDAGIDQQKLGLEAKRIQDDARLRGEEMTSRQAMNAAELEQRTEMNREQILADATAQGLDITAEAALEKAKALAQSGMQTDRLEAEREMFDAQAKARSKEFLSQNKLDRDKYNTSKAQIASEFSDRTDQRLHEMGLAKGSDERRAKEAQLNRLHESTLQTMLKDGRITVEEMRNESEYAWRSARNSMDLRLAEKEEALKKTGMSDEKAKWQAANLLEKTQRTADRKASAKADSDRTAMQTLAALLGFEADIFTAESRAESIAGPDGNVTTFGADKMLKGGDIAKLIELLLGMRGDA